MKDNVVRDPIPYGSLVRVCASVTAAAGFAALIGWVRGLPSMSSLGSGMIPMAPSTALLLVLYGIAAFLRVRSPSRSGAFRASLAINVLGALVALPLLFLSYRGIHPRAEHLGFPIAGMVGGAPIGHMSPVAALCFLFATVSFLASLPSSSSRPRRALAAWCLACLLIAVCFVLLLAYLFGAPLFYVGSFIPPAATTCVAFGALGIALMALAGPQAWPHGEPAGEAASASYALILVFIILAAGIVAAGYLYFKNYENNYRIEVGRQLSAIAELKTSELVRYRTERWGDAAILFRNASFSAAVQRFLANPADGEAHGQLREWLGKFQLEKQYDQIRLLDARGDTRMAIPDAQSPLSADISRRVHETLRSGEVTFQDLYRNEHDQGVYLAVLVPVLAAKDERRAVGVLRLRIDPETYLYPFLRRWPTPSRTAETLLLRRDGDDALFLNELKFRKNTALTLRIPLDEGSNTPAVKAVLGRGTTIRVHFPRVQDDLEDLVEKAEEGSLGGTETVLIVEDEEQILLLSRRILEQFGYRVLTAGTPEDACRLSEEQEGDIHLLLTDVILPEMNGKELKERIEAVRPGIKTLFMSGYTADTIARRGILEKGVDFLQKPFTLMSLARKVRQVLDSEKS